MKLSFSHFIYFSSIVNLGLSRHCSLYFALATPLAVCAYICFCGFFLHIIPPWLGFYVSLHTLHSCLFNSLCVPYFGTTIQVGTSYILFFNSSCLMMVVDNRRSLCLMMVADDLMFIR